METSGVNLDDGKTVKREQSNAYYYRGKQKYRQRSFYKINY